jgi:hypothetical protein
MPEIEDVTELLEQAGDELDGTILLDSVLNPPGDSMGPTGTFYSPWIERGSDGVPHSVPMPTMADMRRMTTGELSGVCERYGYTTTWDNAIDVNKGYLARFNISKSADPAKYAREMKRLKVNGQRAMLGHTRRLAQRHEQLSAIDGNVNQRMMIINESDEPCEECEPLGGYEDTYRNLVADGKIPDEVCLGSCMCTMMRVG